MKRIWKTTHFISGAMGGTAVIGRETPGSEFVRGARARWGGRPGAPLSHHTIVFTRGSGGCSHGSPLPVILILETLYYTLPQNFAEKRGDKLNVGILLNITVLYSKTEKF